MNWHQEEMQSITEAEVKKQTMEQLITGHGHRETIAK